MPRIDDLKRSFLASIGDVAFGMSDGAVSVAGLVFGVAASTSDSELVLLAGATGAIAGAVSMMAGTYLDAQSERDRMDALVAMAEERAAREPEPYLLRARKRLVAAGYTEREADATLEIFRRNPEALFDHIVAYELGGGGAEPVPPLTHAAWMFIADILAASVPVLPFAFFEIGTARIVSLIITGGLMALLGYARGRIGQVNVPWAVAQTMLIAGVAALAGVGIGHLVAA